MMSAGPYERRGILQMLELRVNPYGRRGILQMLELPSGAQNRGKLRGFPLPRCGQDLAGEWKGRGEGMVGERRGDFRGVVRKR